MQLTSPLLDDHDSFYEWPIDGLNSRRICFIEFVMVYSPILISVVGSGASGGCALGVTVGNEVRGGGGVAVAGVVLEIECGGGGVVVAGVVLEIECRGGGVVVTGVILEIEGGGGGVVMGGVLSGVCGAGEEKFSRT